MTTFEYLMVLVSVVLALGLTQVLRGLSKLLQGKQPYVPMAIWGTALFLSLIQYWWALWDTQAVGTWNQLSFMYVLLLPCALFAATELLFPLTNAADSDWRAHFFRVRPWFHGAFLTYHVLGILLTWLLLDIPLTHFYRIPQLGCAACHVVGMMTARPRVHAWLPIVYLAVLIASQVIFRVYLSGL